MSDNRPSTRILTVWADVSARSNVRPIVRRESVHPRRPNTANAGLAGTIAVAIVAVGLIAVVNFRNGAATTVSPTPPGASAMAAMPTQSPSGSAPTPTSATPSPATGTPRPISDFKAGELITALDGWVLSGSDLLVTHDGGRSWSVTASPAPSSERIVGAAFADALHGWVVSDRVPAEGSSGVLGVDVHRTDDGGATWETVELASIPSPGPDPLVGFPTFSVVSSNVAYILLMVEGAADSEVRLYATVDGGRSWLARSELPLRSITFVAPLVGWAIKSDANALVRTTDGGESWVSQRLPAVPGVRAGDMYLTGGPTRLADGRLLLFEAASRDGDRGAFFTSEDDGSTWVVSARGPAGGGLGVSVLDDGRWILNATPLLISPDEGLTWNQLETDLPGPIESITVVDGTRLPAIIAIINCGPNADCFVPRELWISDDAGTSWREATP